MDRTANKSGAPPPPRRGSFLLLFRALAVPLAIALTLGLAWVGSAEFARRAPKCRWSVGPIRWGLVEFADGDFARWQRDSSTFVETFFGHVDSLARGNAPTDLTLYKQIKPELGRPLGAFGSVTKKLRPDKYSSVKGVAVGYPFRCFRGLFAYGPGNSGLVLVEGTPKFEYLPPDANGVIYTYDPLLLPTHVYWPGLLGNIAVFTLALLLPVELTLAAARRRSKRRRSRGLCGGCGYPLDGAMTRCPECGAHVHDSVGGPV